MALKIAVANGKPNHWAFHDARTGADVVLYYRNPTMQEHVSWRSQAWGQTDRPVAERLFLAGLEHGKQILTGFRPGDIEFEAGGPSDAPPDDWVDQLAAARPEIVADFANAVFGAIQVGGPGGQDDAVPFGKNSSV